MVPVLRLSEPAAAASQVAVAVGEMLIPLGHLLHAAEKVSAPEILPGLTEIFLRHAEVMSGSIVVTMVAMVAMVAMVVAMMAMVVVMIMAAVAALIEDIAQKTSDETSCETCQTEHGDFPFAGDARACFMPTPGCLQSAL